MSEVIVPDVRLEPWSTDATVIVDVASLAHWMMEVVASRPVRPRPDRRGGRPPAAHAHHRARPPPDRRRARAPRGATGRLLLGTTLGAFPPDSTGWRPTQRPDRTRRASGGGPSRPAKRSSEHLEEARGRADHGHGPPGDVRYRSGEHCVDELCVLAAVHASWTGGGSRRHRHLQGR
jgi:hypothetical protein